MKLYSGSLEGKVCFQWCFVNEFLITSFCSQTGVTAVEVMAFCVLGVLVLTCLVTKKASWRSKEFTSVLYVEYISSQKLIFLMPDCIWDGNSHSSWAWSLNNFCIKFSVSFFSVSSIRRNLFPIQIPAYCIPLKSITHTPPPPLSAPQRVFETHFCFLNS